MTKIMNNNKVCIISFLICHIYSVNVNDERRKVMNLELIKNNIIIRLITKKEFDVQILIGVLLSLGSIRMIFVMRKLEKERIHDHKKR